MGSPPALLEGPGAFAVLSVDVDSDGRLDIASVTPEGVSVALNRGGALEAPRHTPLRPLRGIGVLSQPAHLAAGDFDADGVLDLVRASHLERCGADMLLGNGDGTFRAGGRHEVVHEGEVYEEDRAYVCTGLVAGDFDSDGRDDVVISHERFSLDFHFGFDVFLSNADGSLQAPVFHSLAGLGLMVSGDMNADGTAALVVASAHCERGCFDMTGQVRVEVHLADGAGSFAAPQLRELPVAYESYVTGVTVGRFDADGSLDWRCWTRAAVAVTTAGSQRLRSAGCCSATETVACASRGLGRAWPAKPIGGATGS